MLLLLLLLLLFRPPPPLPPVCPVLGHRLTVWSRPCRRTSCPLPAAKRGFDIDSLSCASCSLLPEGAGTDRHEEFFCICVRVFELNLNLSPCGCGRWTKEVRFKVFLIKVHLSVCVCVCLCLCVCACLGAYFFFKLKRSHMHSWINIFSTSLILQHFFYSLWCHQRVPWAPPVLF